MVGVAGGSSSAGKGTGGGGGGSVDLTGYATEAWVNENYLSIEFFSSLFKAYDSAATPNEIEPNDGDTTAITNIKAMFGFWTEQYLSALGLNSAGGGGGVTLNEPLESINNSGLSAPGTNENGKTIVWNNSAGKWEYGSTGGGGATALSGLSDVQLGTLSDGNVLAYDSTTGKWVNNSNFIKNTGNTSLSGTFSPSFNEGANLGSSYNRFDYVYATNGVFSSSLKLGGKDVATQYWVGQQGFITSETYTGTVTSVGLTMPTGFSVSGSPVTSSGTLAVSFAGTITKNRVLASPNGSNGSPSWRALVAADIPDLSGTYLTSSSISDMATKTWVGQQGYLTSVAFSDLSNHPTTLSGYGITDAMLTKILSSTSNIDTLYVAGSYRFDATAQGTWPTGVTANYGQMLVICGGGDTVAQMFFPYGDTQAYLRVGNPMKANNGSWKSWKELATTDGNITSATKLQTARSLWGQLFDGTANVSGDMSSVGSITMSGSITMNNNQSIYIKDSGGTVKTALRLNNNNRLELGYGSASSDYLTQIFGGATTGIKFYCGQSNEVASVYRAVDSNQNVRQGIRIGDGLLTWNSTWGGFEIMKYDGTAAHIVATGGVSALGFAPIINSLDAFTITNLTTSTVTSTNWNITSEGNAKFKRVYLDSTRYIYLYGTPGGPVLMYYDGTTSKAIQLS